MPIVTCNNFDHQMMCKLGVDETPQAVRFARIPMAYLIVCATPKLYSLERKHGIIKVRVLLSDIK